MAGPVLTKATIVQCALGAPAKLLDRPKDVASGSDVLLATDVYQVVPGSCPNTIPVAPAPPVCTGTIVWTNASTMVCVHGVGVLTTSSIARCVASNLVARVQAPPSKATAK